MTDAELDAHVLALSDDDVRSIAEDGPTTWDLTFMRPLLLRMTLAKEVLRLREIVASKQEACAKIADDAADKAYRRFAVLGYDHKGGDMIECLEGRRIADAIRKMESQ